MKEEGKKKV